jgi:hypothetical protein
MGQNSNSPDSRLSVPRSSFQQRLALGQRQFSQVVAVEIEQVERHDCCTSSPAQISSIRPPERVGVEHHASDSFGLTSFPRLDVAGQSKDRHVDKASRPNHCSPRPLRRRQRDAQNVVRVGMVMPMTGGLAPAGQQVVSGAPLHATAWRHRGRQTYRTGCQGRCFVR